MKKLSVILLVLILFSCEPTVNSLNKEALKLIGAGNYTEALSLLNEAIAIDDEDDTTWNNISVCYEAIGEYQLALEAAQEAVNNGKEKAAEYSNLGNAYFDLGEVEEAKLAYSKALDLDEDYFYALYGMGSYHVSEGNYDKALEYFSFLYDNNPLNIDVVRHIAYCHFKLGKVDASIAFLEGELEKINSDELEQLLDLILDYKAVNKK